MGSERFEHGQRLGAGLSAGQSQAGAGRLSFSIVLFHHRQHDLQDLLHVLGRSAVVERVWLIDNGGAQWAAEWAEKWADAEGGQPPGRFVYVNVGRNVGFGAGHNQVLGQWPASVSHHVFCNPDIGVTEQALARIAELAQASDATLLMPHVAYPDGRRQELCKLLPTPLNLFARRFWPWLGNQLDHRYLLRDADYSQPFFAPSLSGCFMVCRVDALRAVGGFDERYFLYMEDIDLSRRLADEGLARGGAGAVYLPQVSIVHAFQKGSYQQGLLLKYHIRAAVAYFNKWGWCFDAGRRRLNGLCLRHLPRQSGGASGPPPLSGSKKQGQ